MRKKFPKVTLKFPYRPRKKKKKEKDWVVGCTGLGIGDMGRGFGNVIDAPAGGPGGGNGGGNGGGMGEATNNSHPYEYSCAMLNLTDSIAPIFKYWAKKMIPKDNLFINEEKGMDGYEDTPHVTIKYGLHDTLPDKLIDLTKGFGPIKLNFETVTTFVENPDFDVLKVDVKSDQLKTLNKKINDNTEHTDKFNSYKPHITLAYIKKGTCGDLIGSDFFTGLEDTIDEIYFTSRNGTEHYFALRN